MFSVGTMGLRVGSMGLIICVVLNHRVVYFNENNDYRVDARITGLKVECIELKVE